MFKRNISLVMMVGVLFSLTTSKELGEQMFLFGDLANHFRDIKTSHLNGLADLVKRVEELEYFREQDGHKFSEGVFELQQLREKDTQAIKHLSDEITALIAENKHMKSKFNDRAQLSESQSHSAIQKASTLNQRPPKSISIQMQRSGSSPGTIAFYTTLSQLLVSPGISQKISFDNVITNVNAHISNFTGVFTCSRAGVHVFSWQTLLAESHYIITELVRNGQSVGSEELGSTRTAVSDSSTAVVDLAVNDEVWVRVAAHAVNSDIQPHLTTFSGFRLP
ncbi:uncharacterized protein LOC110443397 [Mizuhopecten yessoensis]|uniref:Complement C1q tumor necrosis factor-related protein 5 n=1 Tax=Mizuhopecten yessoensis TaxID=6573 RepID=A0A210R0W2_MIZYE|nr:uncharacterized protein LOC110443397 [Mizuhopecten yessoensis]OWF54525.1 Complement C1q tumor necrosis factor-related protein 5 [Mizuhopecten yessoensis]